MDLSRYAELFLTETQEHLQTINDALLQLEQSGFDPALVDSFFRAVHTIKGMSATMGYAAVAQLTHEMESLLSDVRDGSRSLDGDLLDSLFHATDALETAVDRSAAGNNEGTDVTEALDALAAVRSRGEGTGAGKVRTAGAMAGSVAAAVATAPGATRIEVRLLKDTQLPGVRAFLILGRLRTIGEIVALHPAETEIQSDAFEGVFVASLRSDRATEEIRSLILSSGDVADVSIGDEPTLLSSTARATSSAKDASQQQGSRRGGKAGTAQVAQARPSDSQERKAIKHVRVEQRRLDALMNLVGELVIARGRLATRAEELHDADLQDALAGASRQISDLQDEIMASRMVPVWQVFDRFPRLVRDAAHSLDKKVELVMEGREIELDRSLLDEIGDPIVHLLRNAVDHGIESPAERVAQGKSETGRLVLSATRDRETVLFTVSDDGRGLDRDVIARKARDMKIVTDDAPALTDEQLFSVIATSGFSTAVNVTDLSGRGVGVDAVVTRVRALGGRVELRTGRGEGTSVTIRLPLTLAIIRAMLAQAGDETYAIPLTQVAETVEVDPTAFRTVRGRPVMILRDEVLPLVRLREMVQLPSVPDERRQMVVLEVASKRAGLIVDDLLGQQEIVVKQFDAPREGTALFSGATILGNGELALIVDVGNLI
jgi:two-component system chemotaxis sensor kinase CheA